MNKTSKMAAVSIVCMIGFMAAGCSPLSGAHENTANSTINQSSSTSTQTTNTQVSSANNTSQGTSTSSDTANTSTTNASSGSSQTSLTTEEQRVVESMNLAKVGKVLGSDFSLKQNIGDVQNVWGKPASESFAGAGVYAAFPNHAMDFGLNKGEQIIDLRSYSSAIQSITESDVRHMLGKPGSVRQTSDSTIWLYPVGAEYQVLWVFPKSPTSRTHVKHISVFWPEGTIDMMAQNVPNPSIVIDNAPGTVGNLFTFTIQNAPKGYYLAELVWVPESGQAMATTADEAATYGSVGGTTPYFEVSGDGKTWSFVYNGKMTGDKGKVKLIYQNTNGSAIVGTGPSVQLK